MAVCTFQSLMNFLGSHVCESAWDFKLNYLRLDSREVKKYDVFIAIKGVTLDGRKFIPQAVNNGASVILIETLNQADDLHIDSIMQGSLKIPQVSVFNLTKRLSLIANDFYQSPSKKLSVIGVTGTNGKTTITQLIGHLSSLLNEKSAILGTIGNGVYNDLKASINTTSSAVDIQKFLADFVTQKVTMVAMEISSHGLVMNRVNGISCAATVFTNLSRDHLDYHKTMDNYANAKWSLFDPDKNKRLINSSGRSIINFDDEYGKQWVKKLNKPTVVSIVAKQIKEIEQLDLPYLIASRIEYHQQGTTIHIASTWGDAVINSQLLGEFNVSNLLLTLATLLTLGFPFEKVTEKTALLTPICGRMEVLQANNSPTVIVDYAHTPDALQKALQAIRTHCTGKLWVIFGCGGDRDSGKRPLMGKIAEQYADKIILTNDNPRTEDEMVIIADIKQGFLNADKAKIIPDRSEAIKQGVTKADSNDVILIAGKGHEDYQIIGKTKHHYSDQEAVKKLLNIESNV